MHYTQCKMVQNVNADKSLPKRIHVAWIPSELARVNRRVELKLQNVWGDWTVTETYETKEASLVERRGHESTKGFGSVVK